MNEFSSKNSMSIAVGKHKIDKVEILFKDCVIKQTETLQKSQKLSITKPTCLNSAHPKGQQASASATEENTSVFNEQLIDRLFFHFSLYQVPQNCKPSTPSTNNLLADSVECCLAVSAKTVVIPSCPSSWNAHTGSQLRSEYRWPSLVWFFSGRQVLKQTATVAVDFSFHTVSWAEQGNVIYFLAHSFVICCLPACLVRKIRYLLSDSADGESTFRSGEVFAVFTSALLNGGWIREHAVELHSIWSETLAANVYSL